jgi:hypothetical protein
MLTAHRVDAALRVEVVAHDKVLEPAVQGAVDDVWQAETAKAPHLFDGPLFSIVAIEPDRILGRITSYRYLVGQRRDPRLRSALDVRPLGVTGILSCPDGIVFAQRALAVELDAGRWELAPSGSVDGAFRADDGAVDVRLQLLDELTDEIGLDAGLVSPSPQPFALVEDGETGITDLGLLMHTAADASSIGHAFAARPTREYQRHQVVRRAALGGFVTEVDLAPASRALLAQAALL